MKAIEDTKKGKVPFVKVDKSLNKYTHVVLFPKQLDRANEMLKRMGLSKEWY